MTVSRGNAWRAKFAYIFAPPLSSPSQETLRAILSGAFPRQAGRPRALTARTTDERKQPNKFPRKFYLESNKTTTRKGRTQRASALQFCVTESAGSKRLSSTLQQRERGWNRYYPRSTAPRRLIRFLRDSGLAAVTRLKAYCMAWLGAGSIKIRGLNKVFEEKVRTPALPGMAVAS